MARFFSLLLPWGTTIAAFSPAMRAYYEDTHNLAEGAGAAALAGALKEKQSLGSQRIGIILTGGNVDREVYQRVLAGTSMA
jgi:threonine dehydratase